MLRIVVGWAVVHALGVLVSVITINQLAVFGLVVQLTSRTGDQVGAAGESLRV